MSLRPHVQDMLLDGEADEIWTIVIKDGSAEIRRAIVRNDEIRESAAAMRERRLGELLMMIRAPLQEMFAEESMAPLDSAPEEIRKLTYEHGTKVLRLFHDHGFTAEQIRKSLNV